MPLYKIVDGVKIECTPEEEAKILQEWADAAAKPRIDPFDTQITPLIKAIVQDLAVATGRTEAETLISIKAKWLANDTNK